MGKFLEKMDVLFCMVSTKPVEKDQSDINKVYHDGGNRLIFPDGGVHQIDGCADDCDDAAEALVVERGDQDAGDHNDEGEDADQAERSLLLGLGGGRRTGCGVCRTAALGLALFRMFCHGDAFLSSGISLFFIIA